MTNMVNVTQAVNPNIVNADGRVKIKTKNGTFLVSSFLFDEYVAAGERDLYDTVNLKNGVSIYLDDTSVYTKGKTDKHGDALISIDGMGNIFVKNAATVGINSENGKSDMFSITAKDSDVTVHVDKDGIVGRTAGDGKITFLST